MWQGWGISQGLMAYRGDGGMWQGWGHMARVGACGRGWGHVTRAMGIWIGRGGDRGEDM